MTRIHTLLMGLASLAALGLAVAPAARAQSLNLQSGDDVLVSGAGTDGIINGMPVVFPADLTTSYSGSPAAQTNGTAVLTVGTGAVFTGGNFGDGLDANGSGIVTVTGGILAAGLGGDGLLAQGSGNITVSGGVLTAGDGAVGLNLGGNGMVTVSGGTITAGDGGEGLLTYGSGSLTVSGGTLIAGSGGYALFADGSESVTVTGGTFTVGSGGDALYSADTGIDLYGSFTDPLGSQLTPGQSEDLGGGSGSFSGTLENDTASQTFTYDNRDRITLHDIATLNATPEPSAFVGLGIGLLGLGALAVKARRRTD